MKNLYDRLKSEHYATLAKERKLYPNTINALIGELESHISFPDLAYGDIATLVRHLGLRDYNPSAISKLFNN